MCFFFFKQKTAYEMRISDWSSDVCSSDRFLAAGDLAQPDRLAEMAARLADDEDRLALGLECYGGALRPIGEEADAADRRGRQDRRAGAVVILGLVVERDRKSVV